MPTITYYAGENTSINNLSASGIGFYSENGFGYSIPVGSYNGRTFITDSTGTEQGPEVDNCRYGGASTVIVGQTGSGVNLLQLPNYLATLNIRFTHPTPVQVQNARIYGYDRVNKLNAPSGVNLYAADIVHPDTTQTLNGSGTSSWALIKGSGYLNLISGPGTSGLRPNGAATSDSRMDWYISLTASPTSVGAKEQFSLWFECEYL